MSGSFYVVTYRGEQDENIRVMGFCQDMGSVQRLLGVFGKGADYEELPGPYPRDELGAALAYEEHKRRHGLRLVLAAV